MENKRIKVGTIREVHRQLLNEGYMVPETALRRWVKTGELPARFSGKTAYVSYEKAVTLLIGQGLISA